jgi:uncharacterized membrane protein
MNENLDKKKMFAGIAYFLFFVPLLVKDYKEDPFVKFHVKQGLILTIAVFVMQFLGQLLMIPIVSLLLIVSALVIWVAGLIIGIKNVLADKTEELPFIGKYAAKFDF